MLIGGRERELIVEKEAFVILAANSAVMAVSLLLSKGILDLTVVDLAQKACL